MRAEDRRFAAPRHVRLRDGRAITIRPLEATDAEAVVDFYADIPDKDGIYYLPPGMRTRGSALGRAATADSPYEVCLVLADDDGTVYGEAWYRWDEQHPQLSELGIGIRPCMQGVGAGRLIMERLMEVGDLYGPAVMWLTAQVENERAWKLYVSMGFRILREQMRGVREDSGPMPEFYMERRMGRRCSAGAASRTINPALGTHLPGQAHVREMSAVRDSLEVNVLCIANREESVCLVSLDHSGLFEQELFDEMRAIVSRGTGVPAGSVLICCTHTHTGGNVWPLLHDSPYDTAYREVILTGLAEAAREAALSSRPARVGSATGYARVGFNRRVCWEDGSHSMYGDTRLPRATGLEGPDDPTHTVLFAVDEAGAVIAICHNNCSHSTCLEGELFASADFPGEARRVMRDALGTQVPVLYLQGASGDISPWDMSKGGPHRYSDEQRLREMGATLAAETLRLMHDTIPIPDPVIRVDHRAPAMDVRLPSQEELETARGSKERGEEAVGRFDYVTDVCGVLRLWDEFRNSPRQVLPLWAVRIGDLAIATNPCELFCQFGLDIRRRSPARHLMISELTNGQVGYVPTMYGVLGGGYSGRPIYWCRMDALAGYRLVDETAAMLTRLWP